ncbi:MAG: TonB-dependent receptor plug domain-containing protein [Rhodocyclaceae bacterium]
MHLPNARPLPCARHYFVLALSVFGCQPWAQAQEEAAYFETLPTVLTVSRLNQPIAEAPGAVTVLDGDFIRGTGYRDLSRIFRLVPGMQVGQERGNASWVTYHGLSNNFPSEMQVLIDGRSVYSPSAFGGVDWAALPLSIDEIDRIEVVRGTNSVTYGANAFLGVINIITKHSAQEPASRVTLRGGTGDIADVRGTVDGRSGPLSLRLNASYVSDSGFDGLNDSQRVGMLTLRGDVRLSPADELMVRVAASDAHEGQGYPSSVFDNNAERESKTYDYVFHLTWTHAPTPGNEWSVNLYHNQERVNDQWTAVALPPLVSEPTYVPLDRSRRARRSHLEVQNRFDAGESAQLVWGGEARRDTVDASFLYAGGDPAPTDMLRAFGNLEWRLAPAWRANLGAAWERYSSEPTHLAPRAFINWLPDSRNTLRLGYARAWQQRPTFEKDGDVRAYDPASGVLLVHPYVPNAELRQPRVDSAEIGYLGHFQTWNSALDVRLFNERIEGFLIRVPVSASPVPYLEPYIGSAQYVNYDRPVTLRGLEYQLRARPWQGADWSLTHTLIDRRASDTAIEDRVAPYSATLSWGQAWPRGWRTTLTALRMGPLAGGDGFVPIYPYVAAAYTTYDARLAWNGRVAGRRTVVSLNAINLGPRHQEIADRSQQAARARSGDFAPANAVSRTVYLALECEL